MSRRDYAIDERAVHLKEVNSKSDAWQLNGHPTQPERVTRKEVPFPQSFLNALNSPELNTAYRHEIIVVVAPDECLQPDSVRVEYTAAVRLKTAHLAVANFSFDGTESEAGKASTLTGAPTGTVKVVPTDESDAIDVDDHNALYVPFGLYTTQISDQWVTLEGDSTDAKYYLSSYKRGLDPHDSPLETYCRQLLNGYVADYKPPSCNDFRMCSPEGWQAPPRHMLDSSFARLKLSEKLDITPFNNNPGTLFDAMNPSYNRIRILPPGASVRIQHQVMQNNPNRLNAGCRVKYGSDDDNEDELQFQIISGRIVYVVEHWSTPRIENFLRTFTQGGFGSNDEPGVDKFSAKTVWHTRMVDMAISKKPIAANATRTQIDVVQQTADAIPHAFIIAIVDHTQLTSPAMNTTNTVVSKCFKPSIRKVRPIVNAGDPIQEMMRASFMNSNLKTITYIVFEALDVLL